MKHLFSLIFGFLILGVHAQNIKTAQLFNPQSNDLSPIISLNEYLIFSFDDLDGGYKRFEYKIVRYDRFWEESNIFTSEYLNGYQKNYIRNYRNSFNTRVNYTHYEMKVPNRDFSFKISGNYGIQLLNPDNGNILIEKRFSVFEDLTTVGVNVERINGISQENQRVQVVVSSNQMDLTQNQNECLLVIIKNNNWNESLTLEQPNFAQPFQFTYNQLDNNFIGGSEYNWFDTKNLNIGGLTTEQVIRDDIYKTILRPNAYTPDEPYIDRPDVNGNYYIRNDAIPNTNNAGFEADYTNVYFALANYTPNEEEDICVYGAFNNFKCSKDEILEYIPETGLWETSILLKQGYYNYGFAVINKTDNSIDYSKITGSYWQTENKYAALFYYRPWGKRYDRLIGYGEGYSRPSQR